MIDLSPDHFWQAIGPVGIEPLVAWLGANAPSWRVQPYPDRPQRHHDLPAELVQPIIDAVLAQLPIPAIGGGAMLSQMMPGQDYPFHVDPQPDGWLTRVHVPLVTNHRAWLRFEEQGEDVHFEAGTAYTFNARRRHSFGNYGLEARVHLLFDVGRR